MVSHKVVSTGLTFYCLHSPCGNLMGQRYLRCKNLHSATTWQHLAVGSTATGTLCKAGVINENK